MLISVLWFGKPTKSPYETQVERYLRGVRHWVDAKDVALRPVGGARAGDPNKVLAAEAALVDQHRNVGSTLVMLDESGRSLDSLGFAQYLVERRDAGCQHVDFVVGSDLGLDASLKQRGQLCLSLSQMTLPHLLARLLLWEQLYRAAQIEHGGGYHRLRVQ